MQEIELLIEQIKEKSKNTDIFVIAIDGYSSSLKTTLANKLKESLNATIFHMDDFYKKRNKNNFSIQNKVDGNINYEYFMQNVVLKLHDNLNKTISISKFNCKKQDFEPEEKIVINKIVIVEGTYSLNPLLGKYYNLSVFLSLDDNIQLERLSKRNPEKIEDFKNIWIPLERNYFEHYKIKENADITIDTSKF